MDNTLKTSHSKASQFKPESTPTSHHIMSTVPSLKERGIPEFNDFSVDFSDEASLKSGAFELTSKIRPEWPASELRTKIFSDGVTNVLIGVYRDGFKADMILIRCYGLNTDQMIDRKVEIANLLRFYDLGRGSQLYATFANGIAYEFIPGEMLTPELIVEEEVADLTIEMFARMHKVPIEKGQEACLWSRLRRFWDLCPDSWDAEKTARVKELGIPSKAELKAEIDEFEGLLKGCDSPVVFCHNDLLLGNIILAPDRSKVTFIDYEYGAPNYLAFDLGNHFDEFVGVGADMDYAGLYPKEDAQKRWLTKYLKAFKGTSEVSEEEVNKLYVLTNQFALLAHLQWGIWSLVQAANSSIDFDFLDYSNQRLREMRTRKSWALNLGK